jgi:hypothetical protein
MPEPIMHLSPLSPEHLARLAASGIDPSTIQSCGYYTGSSGAVLGRLGFARNQVQSTALLENRLFYKAYGSNPTVRTTNLQLSSKQVSNAASQHPDRRLESIKCTPRGCSYSLPHRPVRLSGKRPESFLLGPFHCNLLPRPVPWPGRRTIVPLRSQCVVTRASVESPFRCPSPRPAVSRNSSRERRTKKSAKSFSLFFSLLRHIHRRKLGYQSGHLAAVWILLPRPRCRDGNRSHPSSHSRSGIPSTTPRLVINLNTVVRVGSTRSVSY